MEPTDNVASHISKVRIMAQQLLDLGENIPDIIVKAKILVSQPLKYTNFRCVWSSVDTTRQTYEYLRARLLEEEAYMEGDSEDTNALAAFSKGGSKSHSEASRTKGSKEPQRSKKDIECFCCGQSDLPVGRTLRPRLPAEKTQQQ